MNTASPSADFPSPRCSRAPSGGLAALNVLNVEVGADLPPRAAEPHLAADSKEFGGLLIAFGLAIPAGLVCWAAMIAALIAFSK